MTQNNCQLPHREPKTALPGRLVCPGHRRWLTETLDDILTTFALLPHFYEPGTAVDDGQQVKGKRVDLGEFFKGLRIDHQHIVPRQRA